MNIREALLEVHSKEQASKITNYVGDDRKRFAELMDYLCGPNYRLSQRAAWPVLHPAAPGASKAIFQRVDQAA